VRLVTTHRNADFDAFGAMVGLRLLDPAVVFHFPGGQEVALRSFLKAGLYSYPEIKTGNLQTAELEKVYLVDTVEYAGLEGVFERILQERVPLTIIDHHDEPGSWLEDHPHERIYRRRGSTCTILTELLAEQNMAIPSLEATLLLMGIHEDTGHMLFPETTPEDVRAVDLLLQSGADLSLVKRFAHRELTPHQLRLLNGLASNARTYTMRGHRVTLASLNLEAFEEDLAYVVHKYVDLFQESVFIGLFNEGGKIFLIGRSRHPDVDISAILSSFSGGGHGAAAAGVVRGRTIVEVREDLLRVLQESLPPRLTARSAMSPHIYGIRKEQQVQEALNRLNELRINAMPVFEEEEICGSVTRQLVDAAIHHGLGGVPVDEIMLGNPPVVSPDELLEDVAETMRRSGIRFVVVREDGTYQGLVTRMDVYRHLLPVAPDILRHLEDRFARLAPNRSSVIRILDRQLRPEALDLLKVIGQTAEEMSMKAYLVGGVVRDLLLGIEDEDVDIVVEGDGIAFSGVLAKRLGARVHTHDTFLTAKIMLDTGRTIDIATARSEYYRAPAALPDVQASVLRQDLYRRDFTINTLTLALNPEDFGHLIDFFGGYQDLKSQHIRILHSLSFIEDPTRCFRAVQLCVRLGFKLASDTEKLILLAAQRDIFDQLSGNRLWEELREIFLLPGVDRAMDMMERLNLVKVIHPDAQVGKHFRQKLAGVREVLSWSAIEKLDPPSPEILILFILLENVKEWHLARVAARLDLRGRMAGVIADHRRISRQLEDALTGSLSPSGIYILMEHVDDYYIYHTMAGTGHGEVRERIRTFLTTLRKVSLSIRGRDLIELGLSPGPMVGRVLRETLLAKLDGHLKTREEECDYALRLARV